jgi:hypothetical protein
VLVARRFAFFDFNLKAEALILLRLGCAGFAHEANEKWRKRSSLSTRSPISLTQIIQDDSGDRRVWRKTKITRRLYCLPPGIAACYPRSVNRNIFYIIGVIVVIVIVLKVLHVF